jgi:hypothetical protein
MADYERSVTKLQQDLKNAQDMALSKSNETMSVKKELGN